MNRALLAAAATGVQVGAAIVATRGVVQDVPPRTLALLRYPIDFVCLAPFAWPVFKLFGANPNVGWSLFATYSGVKNFSIMAALGIGPFAVKRTGPDLRGARRLRLDRNANPRPG